MSFSNPVAIIKAFATYVPPFLVKMILRLFLIDTDITSIGYTILAPNFKACL